MSDLVFDAQVVGNEDIGSDIWILRLSTPQSYEGFAAGAFFHIQVDPGGQPLFRRAYSILAAHGRETEILYKVAGAGTLLLSQKRAGDVVSVVGPLGNTFGELTTGQRAILVAGGVGLPPILRWAENLLERGIDPRTIVFAYGARDAGELALRDRVEALGVRVRYATDDGSLGHHGRITDLLLREIDAAEENHAIVTYYACGPGAMLAACSVVTQQTGVEGELALETPMPCGTGVCLGCIVPCRTDGEDGTLFRRTCIDGPILPASEVVWP